MKSGDEMRRKKTQQNQVNRIDENDPIKAAVFNEDRLVGRMIDREPNREVGNIFNKCTETDIPD